MIETPVLIVGGGPVGLALSMMLSRFGVASLLVNEGEQTTTLPKLDIVNCRSMEILRQFGVADAVRAAGNPPGANHYAALAAAVGGPYFHVLSDRLAYQPTARASEKISACHDGHLPLEPAQRIGQMRFEPVLLAAAREAARGQPPAELRFGCRLRSFDATERGVDATIQDVASGRAQHVRAQYLIGCDGPHSGVRDGLNIAYDGTRDLIGEMFIIHLRSNAIADLFPNREPYWHTWIARPGFNGLLSSPDASRNDFVLHRPFPPWPGEPIDLIVYAALGRMLPYEVVQSSTWRPQFLVASSFGRGRVFIAGDATHQYMPTGGLGMNTGLAEAHNLAWKLAACVQGWGGEQLLASYEAERLPVARRNCEHVKHCAAAVFEFQSDPQDFMLEVSARGEQARSTLAQDFETKVSRLYESLGIEIGYRYAGSPIVATDAAQPRANPAAANDDMRYTPSTEPGCRLPSGWRVDGQAVLDQLDPCGFTLLHCAANATTHSSATQALCDAARTRRLPLRVRALPEPELARLYERRFVLVRPDQHVAWRSDTPPTDPLALIDLVRGAT